MIDTAVLSPIIDDSAIVAFSNNLQYLVRQEVYEKKLVVSQKEFHEIFVDVLHRIMEQELGV